MNHTPRLLDQIQIASPCSADWNTMAGDDRKRFCSQCKLHVYNLSAMTRDDAEALLLGKGEGRLCTRFFRRGDGTVLTRDCPVGLKKRLRQAWARACALASALLVMAGCRREATSTAVPVPVAPQVDPRAVMGDYAEPPKMGEVHVPPAAQQPQPEPRELVGRIAVPPVVPPPSNKK